MDALWPEVAEQRRVFEVVVTVPREDGGEPARAASPAARGTRLLVSRPGRGVSDGASCVVVKGPDNSVAG
jgi:hypothetical protein